MHGLIYLIGLIVVVMFILSVLACAKPHLKESTP